jgi:hypothetical protein
MGCSIKTGRGVWMFGEFTGEATCDMIFLLGGSWEPPFLCPERRDVSVDTYKQIVHYFTQKELTIEKVCGILFLRAFRRVQKICQTAETR